MGKFLLMKANVEIWKWGKFYECEILQNLDKKLLAKALRKVDAN